LNSREAFLLRGDLADDRALSARRRREPEREADRGLADAALSGDDDQSFIE